MAFWQTKLLVGFLKDKSFAHMWSTFLKMAPGRSMRSAMVDTKKHGSQQFCYIESGCCAYKNIRSKLIVVSKYTFTKSSALMYFFSIGFSVAKQQ